MIWDETGFHTAHDLPVRSNVTLIKLPPYSPELNGIENLWHYLHSHFWSNRVYLDYDDLFEVAESTWRKTVSIQNSSRPSVRRITFKHAANCWDPDDKGQPQQLQG